MIACSEYDKAGFAPAFFIGFTDETSNQQYIRKKQKKRDVYSVMRDISKVASKHDFVIKKLRENEKKAENCKEIMIYLKKCLKTC